MAIKYYERYPQRWESPSQDYPQGAFKNLSALGEQDGSYLEKDWLNDKSGFFGALLRNAEMTPNGLVDTAQKSQFYDALIAVASRLIDTKISTKQDKLTFVGDGPEVMKRGAYGIGGAVGLLQLDDLNSLRETAKRGGIIRPFEKKVENMPAYGVGMAGFGGDAFFTMTIDPLSGVPSFAAGTLAGGIYTSIGYTSANTRTDKNNVLHAGTSTPINTLNVSDMSQEVINNDLLTVTSGAVFRSLASKRSLEDTEFNSNVTVKGGAILRLYSAPDGSGYIQNMNADGSHNSNLIVPKKDGTIALTSDIPTASTIDYGRTCALGVEQLITRGAGISASGLLTDIPANSVVTRSTVVNSGTIEVRYRPIIRTGW